SLFVGYGYDPIFVEGSEPELMHQKMAAALDLAHERIRKIQDAARNQGVEELPVWPMIILRSPKGWTGPESVDGHKTEDFWRSHQVPLANVRQSPDHLKQLEAWLQGYKPAELVDDSGRLIPQLRALAPEGARRMGANPHANGGSLCKPLQLPEVEPFAVDVPAPGTVVAEATRVMGTYLRGVVERNAAAANFRLV